MLQTQRSASIIFGSIVTVVALAGCSSGGGAVEVDLGSGPAVAGEVRQHALEGVDLTLASWGGIYQEGQVAAASKPFMEASGARMLDDGPMEYAKIKAQVQSGNVTWDIVDTDAIWAATQCGEDGLLMPLNTSIVDTSNIPEGLVGDCYVPAMQYGYVIMYNTEKYPVAPTGWSDFFDTVKFPGKRAIAGFEDVGPGVFEGALLADGVAAEELYPLDMDRVYNRLDTIKSSLIYWKTGAESTQMMESGEADMALVWSGRGYEAVNNGAPYAPIWDESLVIMDALAVPRNARNPDAAFAYINYYLGAEQQAKLTELTSYSPVHTGAQPQLDALARSFLITNPEVAGVMVPTNATWWGKNYDEQLTAWLEWMQS
ncbi:ABC transporter substrate-binding protein [Lysinibacter sp. HNR]|uniref:ABC transporter substrate-binding protein n=1 Tax=Lysinibacter sp. HNR TaxID=3031408 RepID=UPI00243525E2|nr:ABC transporter substrate-binding protein [Lysinibacter sp. HNR]WGD37026.1 ABC transporter substrate-binding protein [Lysinibacter sp. HNR]